MIVKNIFKMPKFITGIVLCVLPLLSKAQSEQVIVAEDSLKNMFQLLYQQKTDQAKKSVNRDILDYFSQVLSDRATMQYTFDSLNTIGKLTAPDGSFRIFTWNIPMEGFTHEYHGLIQRRQKKKKDCDVYLLSNGAPLGKQMLNSTLSVEQWPGALYYEIHRNKHGGDVFYTLLGFNFNDRYSDKKVIEALYFDKEGNPMFGKPVFVTEEGTRHRVLFEYSGDVVFNLRYNSRMKMIVFDHLAPIEPELAGHPRFYAPDFSYDGYRFSKGKWEYRAELDVRNE